MDIQFRLALTPADLRQIGRVAVWSSMLAIIVEHTIWHLSGSAKASIRQLTWDLAAERKVEWLKTYAKTAQMTPAERDELDGLTERIKTANENRNFVIH